MRPAGRIGKLVALRQFAGLAVVVADDHEQILVPIAEADDGFVFGRGPDDPSALLFIDSAGVFA